MLCFPHGAHPLSPLHEGSCVSRGLKHVVRTDVLSPTEACADDEPLTLSTKTCLKAIVVPSQDVPSPVLLH